MIFRSLCLIAIVSVPFSADVQAQLFGARTPRDFARRSSTGTSTLFGADLAIPERRGPGAFVGVDPTDTPGFVGIEQADVAPPVEAATESLQEAPVLNVNQVPARQTAGGIYAPRLTVDFPVVPTTRRRRVQEFELSDRFSPRPSPKRRADVISPLLTDPAQRVQAQLVKTLGTDSPGPIRVTVENRTATLAGAVASAKDRAMAELLVSFEPGIDQVKNELVVQQSTPE